MRDPEWVSLTDAQRGQLVAIWLLAADRNGVIPASPQVIQKLCFMDSIPDLKLFIELDFIVDDDSMASEWRQCDPPDKIREEESREEKRREETEKKGAVALPVNLNLNINAWSNYEEYRKESKIRKLQPRSVQKQQEWLAEQGDYKVQQEIVDNAIRNGHQGLFPQKSNGKQPATFNPHSALDALEDL